MDRLTLTDLHQTNFNNMEPSYSNLQGPEPSSTISKPIKTNAEQNINQQFSLRPMSPFDIPICKQLSSEMGWAHRQNDWAQAFRICVGAVLENKADVSIVGTAMVCLQGEYATIGLIIVRTAYQGQRLGKWLMEWAIEVAGKRNLVLYSTEAGLRLYEKIGFEAVGTIVQYQAVVIRDQSTCRNDTRVRTARSSDLPRLVELCKTATGYDRYLLLTDICALARQTVVIEEIDKDSREITAFGISRQFGRGYVIGPIVATSMELARLILLNLVNDLQGEFVRLDCPKDSGLEDLLDGLGLERVGSAVQMIRGEKCSSTEAQQFALASQALG